MDEILRIISTRDVLISILGVFITISYYFFFTRFLQISRERRSEKKYDFFQCITAGLKNNAIKNYDDIINIYKGIRGLSSEDLTFRAGLSKWLREYLVDLISGKIDKQIEKESLTKWKEIISNLISENDKTSPYADLPSLERSIISDISSFLDKNDNDSIRRKLGELASSIQARNDDFAKLKSINRWSVPLAIVGLILTTVFGVISLFK